MNRHPVDLREAFLDAVLQHRGHVVHLGNGQIAAHRAVARHQDAVLRLPHPHLVAVQQPLESLRQQIQELLDLPGKLLHLPRTAVARRDVPPQRLDVNVHVGPGVAQRQDAFFQFRGPPVRLTQAQLFVHFQVQLHEQLPVLLLRRQVVDGQALALRQRADRFEEVLALRRARLHVHHHVRRHDLPDARLDGVGQRVHLLQVGAPRHAHRHVHEVPVARAPHPHPLRVQNPVHLRHGLCDAPLQTHGRGVQQRVQRAPPQLRAHPDHHPGHGQGRQRVRVDQPGQVPRFSGPHQRDSRDHHHRAPHVGRKMQRVRLQRFALELPRRLLQRLGPRQVHQQRHEQHHDGRQARLDVHAAEKQPRERFVDDVQRRH